MMAIVDIEASPAPVTTYSKESFSRKKAKKGQVDFLVFRWHCPSGRPVSIHSKAERRGQRPLLRIVIFGMCRELLLRYLGRRTGVIAARSFNFMCANLLSGA